jgi:hypothetical protein
LHTWFSPAGGGAGDEAPVLLDADAERALFGTSTESWAIPLDAAGELGSYAIGAASCRLGDGKVWCAEGGRVVVYDGATSEIVGDPSTLDLDADGDAITSFTQGLALGDGSLLLVGRTDSGVDSLFRETNAGWERLDAILDPGLIAPGPCAQNRYELQVRRSDRIK